MPKTIDKSDERCIYVQKSTAKGYEFQDCVKVTSHNHWFGKPFTVKCFPNKIVFTHRGIDYLGKVRDIKIHNSAYNIEIREDLPFGTFFFDEEETNLDQIIVYFNPIKE